MAALAADPAARRAERRYRPPEPYDAARDPADTPPARASRDRDRGCTFPRDPMFDANWSGDRKARHGICSAGLAKGAPILRYGDVGCFELPPAGKMLDPKTRLRYTWDDSVRVGVQGDGGARLCSSVCIVGGRIDRWEVWGRTPVYGATPHVSWLRGCRIAWLRNSPRLRFMMSGLRRRLSSTGRMRSIPIRTTRWLMSRCDIEGTGRLRLRVHDRPRN